MAAAWRQSGSRPVPEATCEESIARVDAELVRIGEQAMDPVEYENRCNGLLDLRNGLTAQFTPAVD